MAFDTIVVIIFTGRGGVINNLKRNTKSENWKKKLKSKILKIEILGLEKNLCGTDVWWGGGRGGGRGSALNAEEGAHRA